MSTQVENWEFYKKLFVKVMPVDYRRALQEMQLAQNAATNADLPAEGA